MSSSISRPAFEVNRSLMSSGVVLLCVGFFMWLIGAALSATALGQAAMKWIDQLEESPSEMARRRAQSVQGSRLGRLEGVERTITLTGGGGGI